MYGLALYKFHDVLRVSHELFASPMLGAALLVLDYLLNRVVAVALNLLYGAAVLQRVQLLRAQGIALPPGCSHWRPLGPDQLEDRLNSMRIPA